MCKPERECIPPCGEEIRKRIEDNKGTWQDVVIRASMMWDNCNDLDLQLE